MTASKPKTDDWFRNNRWDAGEQSAFFARLGRSRGNENKAQYARIKALALQETGDPANLRAALDLLNRIESEWPHDLESAQRHLQMAECHDRLNDVDSAVQRFRTCLERERVLPRVVTTAWTQFPLFIIRRKLTALYDEALRILKMREASRFLVAENFAVDAVQAIVASERRQLPEARVHAVEALKWASAVHSGFRYHPDIGLVRGHEALLDTLRGIATRTNS